MKPQNRDLLVLTGRAKMDQQQLEHEVQLLNDILYHVESIEAFCSANELIDINRHRIVHKPYKIQRAARERSPKAFVFINCNN